MKFINKENSTVISRVVCLMLVCAVLVLSIAGCGKKSDKSATYDTPEAVVTAYSEAYSKCDFKTADSLLLYNYDEVMVAATGKYESAEEYRKVSYACDSNEDYYEVMNTTAIGLYNDIYGEDFTVKATVGSCKKLDDEKTQNIKDYYTKFYEACDLKSDDFFKISDIEEIYVATCKCEISGELEESTIDEIYFVYKIGDKYKLIQCNDVAEDNVMDLIDNIPARTTQLESLVGQGAFKDQPSFNEYFYILGLQNQ